MKKTIFITGTSSGIGRAAVFYFHARGWNVAAAMRDLTKGRTFESLANVLCVKTDVRNKTEVNNSIEQTIKHFGALDVVVNNAGYGLEGAFEVTPEEKIRDQFETNFFGVHNVIRAVLPYFKKQKKGTIITVTSVGGLFSLPLYSSYHASKWAIEGFCESLQYELHSFNIKIKVVEPGLTLTDFHTRSLDLLPDEGVNDYTSMMKKAKEKATKSITSYSASPDRVASTIYKAANDSSWKLRYTAGGGSGMILGLKWFLPQGLFHTIIRKMGL